MARSAWRKVLAACVIIIFLAGAICFTSPLNRQPVPLDAPAGRGKAAKYGVGLSFTPGYGTASVYFSNGTIVDIAKIPGNSSYKEAMQPVRFNYHDAKQYQSEPRTSVAPEIDPLQPKLSLRSLHNYLLPWRHKTTPTNPLSLSITPMLSALKAATEEYLGLPLTAANVIFQAPVSEEHYAALRSGVLSAASSLSIDLFRRRGSVDVLAMGANGIGERFLGPQHKPQQLILTIDYNEASLTTHLVQNRCDFYENVRTLHNAQLGASNARSMWYGKISHRNEIMRVLRNITTLPSTQDTRDEHMRAEFHKHHPSAFPSQQPDPCDRIPNQITDIVLLGDYADAPLLHDALRKALPIGLYNNDTIATVKRAERSTKWGMKHAEYVHDPVFAASRGAAYDCWEMLRFGMEPSCDPFEDLWRPSW